MKKILFAITLLIISITNVNAESCDAYDIKRLKEIAEGVEITYELQPPVEGMYSTIRDNYKINITGLTSELVVVNEENNEFYYSHTNFDEVDIFSSGKKKLILKSKYCSQTLKNITLKLPVYNSYHEHELCEKEENKDLYVCQEWIEEYIDTEYFLAAIGEQVEEENDKNNFFYNNYKLLITIGILLLIVILVIIVLKRKKGVLE